MKKQYKIMFKGVSKSLRRLLHDVSKHPVPFNVMSRYVEKPETIKLADGTIVPYNGP